MVELRYAPGEYPADQIEGLVRSEVGSLRADVESGNIHLPDGLSVEDLGEIPSESLVVRRAGGSFTGIGEAILIVVAGKVAERIIDELIVPRIRKRFGSRAIGKRLPPAEDDEKDGHPNVGGKN